MGDHIRFGRSRGRSSVTTGFIGATKTSHFNFAMLLISSPRLRRPTPEYTKFLVSRLEQGAVGPGL